MPEQVTVPAVCGEEFAFASAVDGLQLQAYRWRVAGALEGVVVISHGAAEHGARYGRFAVALAEQGFETWALDHRGHGRSPGPDGLGDTGPAGWDGLVADIAQLVRTARRANPEVPLALFGHSMGAFVAQQFCAEHSPLIDAAVLSGTAGFNFPEDMPELPAINFNAGFEPARTPYDWLSRDEAEVDDYIADPLCGFESVAPVFDIHNLRHLSAAETLANIRQDLPMLMVAGDEDPVNWALRGLHRLEEKLRQAGVEQIDMHVYEGGRHEMLNETNREEVTRDVIDWLHNVLHSDVVRKSFIRYAKPRS